MKKFKTVILIILLFSGYSFAENFHQINIEDGLSSRHVTLISKDSSGFMWFYTSLGINRFDGSEIRSYSLLKDPAFKDRRNPPSIRACDPSGNLWFALKTGEIYTYDRDLDSFNPVYDIATCFSEPVQIDHFYIDEADRFWFYISSVLYLFDPEEKTMLPIAEFPEEQIRTIRQTDKNTFYIGTLTALYRIQTDFRSRTSPEQISFGETIRVETLYAAFGKLYIGTFSQSVYVMDLSSGEKRSLASIIPFRPIRAITSMPDHTILIGTDGAGLYCIDTKMKVTGRYVADENNINSLSGNTVTHLFVDDQNRIWIGTYTNGISVLDPDFPEIRLIQHKYHNPNSLGSNHVNAVIEDSDGDLWYGTNNGVSLHRVKEKRWQHFLNDPGGESQSSAVVLTLCEDTEKNIWLGGFGMGTWRINKRTGNTQKIPTRNHANDTQGVSTDHVYSVYADKENVWIGGIEGELTRYNLKESKYDYYPIECIGHITQGNENRLLIATCDGLAVLNKENGEINRYATFGSVVIQYPIRCLLQTATGDIWMATSGNGLVRFNPDSGESKAFNTDNGLSSNAVTSLSEDHKGYLWFCTGTHLYRINSETEMISEMNELIPINGAYYNQNAFYTKRDGQLILGTANGAIEFMPDFVFDRKSSPRLVFTNFELLYKIMQPGDKGSPLKKAIDKTSSIRLKSNQNYFSLSYSAINFIDPYQIGYTYILDDFDPDWRQGNSGHTASYMNVPPGDYRFRLKAINKYTKEVLDERLLEISVSKPLWASYWAWLLYFILAAGLVTFVILYIRNRIEKHNSKEKIKFFINVAHDIRIPVSLIKAPLSELEEQETLSVRGKKTLATAIHNVEKLFGMVT